MSANGPLSTLALALVALMATPSAPATAQSLTTSDITSVSQPSSDTITDVFIGKDTRGPYTLSWKDIEAESESIVISGQRLSRGPDYTIDAASGVIAFTEALRNDAIARVTYRRLPGKSLPNTGATSLPVNLRLLGSETASLNFTGLYKGSDGTSGSSLSVLGLSGGLKLGQSSDVSSTFMISQAEGKSGDLSDRSAMKFATSTSLGGFQFKGAFARSGEQFASAKDYGFEQAKQSIDLAAAFGKPTDVVSASFNYKAKEDISTAQKGASSTATEEKVVLNLDNAPKLTLSRAETELTNADKSKNSTTTDTVQLDQSFGQKTAASALLQNTQSTSDGNRYNTRIMGMTLQTSAVDNVQFKGKFVTKDSDLTGGETGVDFGVKAAPSKRFSFDANHSSISSDQNGQQATTGLKMAICPIDQLSFSADLSLFDMDAGSATSAAFVVAARPVDALKVEGTYSGKQVIQGDNEQQRGVRLEAQPADFIKVSAGMGEKETGAKLATSRDAGLEIGAGDKVRIKSSIKQSFNGPDSTLVTDYSGTVKPVNGVELSGAYKDRLSTVADELESKMLRVALGQANALRLTGQYLYNPEDNSGNVERSLSQGLGIEMVFGDLGLAGALRQKDEYLIGKLSLEKEIQLKLAIFRHGSLTTGWKLAEALAATQDALTTYSVGYTHVLGSTFNLSLIGELLRSQSQDLLTDQEYKATAKVGVSF